MRTYRIFVGTGENKRHEKIDNVPLRLKQCASFLSSIFGGCTIIPAIGAWNETPEKLIEEESVIFEISTDKPQKINKAAKMLKNIFEQNSVLVSSMATESRFL